MSFRNYLAKPFDVEPLSFNDSGLGEGFALDDMLRMSDGLLQDSHHGLDADCADELDRLFAAEANATTALDSNREDQGQRPSLEFDSKRFGSIPEELSFGSLQQQEAEERQRHPVSFDSIQPEMERQQQRIQVVETKLSMPQRSNDFVPASVLRRCINEPMATKQSGRKSSKSHVIKTDTELDPTPYNHELYQEQVRRSSENDAGLKLKATGESKCRSRRPKSTCSRPKRRDRKSTKQARRKSTNDLDEITSEELKFQYFKANRSIHLNKRRITLDSASAAAPGLIQLRASSVPALSQLLGHGSRASLLDYNDSMASNSTFEYQEAFINLAESMKRTDLSRRLLNMQSATLVREQSQQQAWQKGQALASAELQQQLHQCDLHTTTSTTSGSISGASLASIFYGGHVIQHGRLLCGKTAHVDERAGAQP